jgi:hypothetical protein
MHAKSALVAHSVVRLHRHLSRCIRPVGQQQSIRMCGATSLQNTVECGGTMRESCMIEAWQPLERSEVRCHPTTPGPPPQPQPAPLPNTTAVVQYVSARLPAAAVAGFGNCLLQESTGDRPPNSPHAAVEHVCAAVLVHQCLCYEGVTVPSKKCNSKSRHLSNSPHAAVEHVCGAVLVHQCLCYEGACACTSATRHTLQQQEALQHITRLSLQTAAAAAAAVAAVWSESVRRLVALAETNAAS